MVRQRAFSERRTELMNTYTNQQLTSAEVIAKLIDMAKELAAEKSRGARFSPPLNPDELAFYDAVAQNESVVAQQGRWCSRDGSTLGCRLSLTCSTRENREIWLPSTSRHRS